MANNYYYIGADQPLATGYVQADGTMQTLADIQRDGASDLEIELVDQASLTSIPESLRGAKYIVSTTDMIEGEYLFADDTPSNSDLLVAYLQNEAHYQEMMFMVTTESGELETINVPSAELTAALVTNQYNHQKQWIISGTNDSNQRAILPVTFDIVRNNIDGIDYYSGVPAGSPETYIDEATGQMRVAIEFPWQFTQNDDNRLIMLGDGSIVAFKLKKTLLHKTITEMFYLFDGDVGFQLLFNDDGIQLRTGRREQLIQATIQAGDSTLLYGDGDQLVVTYAPQKGQIQLVRTLKQGAGQTVWSIVVDLKKLELINIHQTTGTKYHDAEIVTNITLQSEFKYHMKSHYLKHMRAGFWIIWDGEQFIKIGQDEGEESHGLMDFDDTVEGQIYHMKIKEDTTLLSWVTQEGVLIVEDRTDEVGVRSYLGGRVDDYPILFEIMSDNEEQS
ncbi:hypothetical protein EQG49_05560 [Periweissella cryptocerci]|uniref:Uncharacterized protein n=1 Tax=Periweissella cryptocerci TaxID=2506420 RepID=A0A4P6YTF4_9LACO|nr:hypothetical protein [Periweissella cryptocerci]QBO35962.1 hypothetical protein EQG49_05560 [Periweissella cryptocerci]